MRRKLNVFCGIILMNRPLIPLILISLLFILFLSSGCGESTDLGGQGQPAEGPLLAEVAADLPRIACQHGAKLVIINRDDTPLDGLADAVVRDPIGATTTRIAAELEALNRD